MLFGKPPEPLGEGKLLPIDWHGVTPEEATGKTPKRDKTAANHRYYESRYVPVPKKKYRVYIREGRETVNISVKKDISYEEYLDAWVEVCDAIVERQEND
jgi:hypothetical protein